MKQKKHLLSFLTLALIVIIVLSACGGVNQEEQQEEDPNAAITQVVETAMAALTLTSAVQSPTPSLTPTILPTNTPAATLEPSPTATTVASLPTTSSGPSDFIQPTGQTSSCDIGGFVRDVTIPDGTTLAAGQSFTKTWEIKNNGTCTWNKNYTIVFYGGEQMSDDTIYAFTEEDVEPGENVQISVKMTAPTTTGKFVSYWVLRNDLQQNFFVDGSSIFVEINVSSATLTPTITTAPNTAPTVSISEPVDGATFASGVTITFTGIADDAEQGNISSLIEWSSNLDGELGTAASINVVLSDGDHTITATIMDKGRKTASVSIDITVGP